MTRYFAQNTPRAGLEHMMMSVPGFQKRGGGMMILSRFCYKPEDVDCRYCLHYRRRSCQVRTCPYIAERLKSGAIEYLDLILEYFGHIPHAGLHKRIQAVEHWSGPDQAVLHTVSVHLRSRFADRVWDDAPPGYLAALYLLASKERLWQPALPALSHDSIDFSRIVSKPHGFAIQDYPIFYSARRLYDLKSPMEAEDLAHPKLVSDLDFHNIIYATMIARYGKAVMDASKPEAAKRRNGSVPLLRFFLAACLSAEIFCPLLLIGWPGCLLSTVRALLRQFRRLKQIVAMVTCANQSNHLIPIYYSRQSEN